MCGSVLSPITDAVGLTNSSSKTAEKAAAAAKAQAEQEAAQAEQTAATAANAKTQMQRRALRENSLLAGGATTGRSTLGV